ncbi:MAG: dienelactone hydrolase family protein [Azospirillaceae bacterium]|nr:dienelactone hydrolase family protein [Azospirillaceae bacterium]
MPDITIEAADGGSFTGYLARPQSGSGPGVVVIQEIFGVNAGIRDLADGLAAQGYVVLAPDLFWRQEPGVQITDKTEAEWARAFELLQGFDIDKGILDLKATLALLRTMDGVTGKVGTVGYCLGGKLAFLMATRSDVDAAVSYYGVGLADNLGEIGSITKPLMLHIAEKDQFVPPAAQSKIRDALAPLPQVETHSYAACDHAFARVGGAHFDAAAATLANQRTADFLALHLRA